MVTAAGTDEMSEYDQVCEIDPPMTRFHVGIALSSICQWTRQTYNQP